MATMSIAPISAGARSSVLALQQISSQMAGLQLRLSTGKKVNSALDNPSSFFTASALSAQAGALNDVLDASTGVQGAISAASNGIDAITSLVQSAKSLALSAQASSDPATKASYATQFNALMSQANQIAADSSFNGINLLTGGSSTATFNADGSSSYTVTGVDATSTGLGISTVTDFSSSAEVNAALAQGNAALQSLSTMSSSFATAATVLSVRQDFSKSMVSFLNGASDQLTASDTNEDAASLLALQTRQAIASTALTLTANADTNVLRLFGQSKATFG
jgi:flagellin